MKLILRSPSTQSPRFRVKNVIAVIAVSLMATLSIGTMGSAATADSTLPAKTAISSPRVVEGLAVDSGLVRAATGQYEYICIGIDGNSWSLRVGQKTTDCKGSYLHKYINGKKIASYRLTIGGGVAAPRPPWKTGCVITTGSTAALFIFPPTGVTAWVVVGGLTAAGLYVSCTA